MSRRAWTAAAATAALVVVAVAGAVYARSRSAAPDRSLATLDVPAGIGLRCTLPVEVHGRLATLSLPDGRLTAATVQPGPNDQGDSFAGGRWLPVEHQTVSPDGSSYAYVTFTSAPLREAFSTLFGHDVRTGQDRQLWSGEGQAVHPVWTPRGIFFLLDFDLWLMDPGQPGVAHRVGPNPPARRASGDLPRLFFEIGNDAAWALTSSAPLANGPVTNDVVLRMDLADGTVTRWYQAPPGSTLTLLGLDGQGHPLLGVARPSAQFGGVPYEAQASGMLLLAGRDHAVPIALPDPGLGPDRSFTDAHGVWISGADALWLYRGGRLARVATIPAAMRPPTPRVSLPRGAPAMARGSAAVVLGPCA